MSVIGRGIGFGQKITNPGLVFAALLQHAHGNVNWNACDKCQRQRIARPSVDAGPSERIACA